MKDSRVSAFKILTALSIFFGVYTGMDEFGFSYGLAGAVSAGSTIIIVQVMLTELDFYDRFKQNQSG